MIGNETLLGGRLKFWKVTSEFPLSKAIERIISEASLPNNRNAAILLKPNLNNDLIGLTGNSTDLRVLYQVIKSLQKKGYRNLMLLDGPNLGIARTGADVLKRLGVSALCQSLGVICLDANRVEATEVTLHNGIAIRIADIFLNADCILNVPTIKTHAEVMFSCCMKNLIGVVVGSDKRKIHKDLVGSILGLNELTALCLNIVDGMIAMEGDGPGDGIPRELNWVISGEDPFLTDAVIARLIGLEPLEEVPYLSEAFRQGLIDGDDAAQIFGIEPEIAILKPRPRKWSSCMLGHWSIGRFRDVIRPLFDNKVIRPFLHRHGVVQDVYEGTEADVRFEFVRNVSCGDCSLYSSYCPMDLPPDSILDESRGCIQCGYCYWVCGSGKIRILGNKGYLARHIDRYKRLIEKTTRKLPPQNTPHDSTT